MSADKHHLVLQKLLIVADYLWTSACPDVLSEGMEVVDSQNSLKFAIVSYTGSFFMGCRSLCV